MTFSSLISAWRVVGAGTTPAIYDTKIFANTDLAVYFDGVLMTLTTDYTVTGVGVDAGGTVVPVLDWTGVDVQIFKRLPQNQASKYTALGELPAGTLEANLDRLAWIAQDLQEQLDRSLVLPRNEAAGFSNLLPANAARLGKLLSFNLTTGDPEALAAPAGLAALAAITADITTVAGISAAVSSVAGLALSYAFDASTSMADPGAGDVRLNDAALASVTAIAIDDLDSNANDLSPYLVTFDDGGGVTKGHLIIRKAGTATTFAIYAVTALADNSGWVQLTVAHVASSGAFTDTDGIFLDFIPIGPGLVNIVEDTTPQFGGDTDGQDFTLSKIKLKDYGEVTNAIGSIGGGTQDIDLELGNVISGTVDTSTTTFTVSNPTASDELCSLTIILTNGGSQTVNWPASFNWEGGTAPALTTAGVDVISAFTIDGGTAFHAFAASLDSS